MHHVVLWGTCTAFCSAILCWLDVKLCGIIWCVVQREHIVEICYFSGFKCFQGNLYTRRAFDIISYRLSQKKLQSAFGDRLRKNPLWNLKNLTGLWNYDNFSTIQWRPHLIWPSSHKEIWIFVKEVIIMSLSSKFCHWNVCGFTGRLGSQKTGLQSYYNFMHTFLTQVVPDNQKACQICKII